MGSERKSLRQGRRNVLWNRLTIGDKFLAKFFFEEVLFCRNQNGVIQSKEHQQKYTKRKRTREKDHAKADQQIGHVQRMANISVRPGPNHR